MSRDFLVHGMVPYYAVAEIRTHRHYRSKDGAHQDCRGSILSVSKADEPEAVTDANTLLHRVHALFMTLEYLNICQYSRKDGPLRYLQELEQFRADTSSLPVLMTADSLIRKKLYRLTNRTRENSSAPFLKLCWRWSPTTNIFGMMLAPRQPWCRSPISPRSRPKMRVWVITFEWSLLRSRQLRSPRRGGDRGREPKLFSRRRRLRRQ